ncbi:hypothetical protein J7399_09385 [Shimia sp. R9_1]|uniref:hypothetical protein n=1 Tax=Shimia sp. R9_1 TaxID=2821111 RepID=UPI001ADAB1DB|nr:hypothetical protein [Shimia sp. R9_1]MBO9407640.1 hypothetical protein [Shimia sp. R9_1]
MNTTYPASCGVSESYFADALTATFRRPNALREVFPEAWCDMAARLHTLIQDCRMNTCDMVEASPLPMQVVSRYRAAVV